MADFEQLLEWNRRGLVPAPNEDEAAFVRRVDLSLARKRTASTQPHVLEAEARLAELYDIRPDWVPIIYSSQGLGIWHGGGTIIELVEDSHVPAIQLRRSLKGKGRYLGIYSLEEFLEHEFSHVGRIAFEERRFEELFAYRTSRSKFRRFFGPIIQSSKEVWVFLLTLIIALGVDYFFFAVGWLEAGLWALLFYLAPLGLIGFGLQRLMRAQRAFKRAYAKLSAFSNKPMAILYRLSDIEIRRFACSSPEGIRTYMAEHTSLRWRIIRTAYL